MPLSIDEKIGQLENGEKTVENTCVAGLLTFCMI